MAVFHSNNNFAAFRLVGLTALIVLMATIPSESASPSVRSSKMKPPPIIPEESSNKNRRSSGKSTPFSIKNLFFFFLLFSFFLVWCGGFLFIACDNCSSLVWRHILNHLSAETLFYLFFSFLDGLWMYKQSYPASCRRAVTPTLGRGGGGGGGRRRQDYWLSSGSRDNRALAIWSCISKSIVRHTLDKLSQHLIRFPDAQIEPNSATGTKRNKTFLFLNNHWIYRNHAVVAAGNFSYVYVVQTNNLIHYILFCSLPCSFDSFPPHALILKDVVFYRMRETKEHATIFFFYFFSASAPGEPRAEKSSTLL